MAATNSINSASSLLRLTGLSGSGIDTDSIVKQLMTAEKIPLNKLYQKRQLAEWKQDAYRDITNKLRELKDTYFNTTKPSSNLTSRSSFIKFTGTSSNSTYVTVSGNSDAVAGSHTVSVISLATSGESASASGVTDDLKGVAINDADYNMSGKKINITLDGITREITLGDYSASKDTIGDQIQTLVNSAFGSDKIKVGYDAGTKQLSFATINGASRITLSNGSGVDGLTALGFTNGATNRLNISKSLEDLSKSFKTDLNFNTSGELDFTINGKHFTFSKSVSLSSMMNSVNSDADAQVNMKYDEVTDQIVLTAKQTGAGATIRIVPSGGDNFFGSGSASGIDDTTFEQGTDASAKIDTQTVTRSTNTFTLNGVTYTLLKENSGTESETVNLSVNTDDVYNNIKSFVDKYNEAIDYINTKLDDKYDSDYPPLTDEQKEGMSDDDVKNWEAKAKSGLLHNDSMLQNIVYNMRKALSDTISGVSSNLSSIGITTGTYSEKGKLNIDETKLKTAIAANSDAVADLFTKKADKSYAECTTTALRTERYNTEGLANRLSDILDDNIRTTNGKGLLLQTAGIQGDTTEYTSTLYNQIDDYNDEIDAMVEKLNDKETAYYAKFTALEKYISQMSAQSSWLASQFSSSS